MGRLDLDSEGLLLLTDDGELTQKLLHPSHQVEKEYLVWVTGDVSRGLPVLSGPMDLDGVPLSPAKVRRGRTSGGVTQLSITICQGKNRQVRRMCGQAGLNVLRLKRVREGGALPGPDPGARKVAETGAERGGLPAAKALIFCPVPDRT